LERIRSEGLFDPRVHFVFRRSRIGQPLAEDLPTAGSFQFKYQRVVVLPCPGVFIDIRAIVEPPQAISLRIVVEGHHGVRVVVAVRPLQFVVDYHVKPPEGPRQPFAGPARFVLRVARKAYALFPRPDPHGQPLVLGTGKRTRLLSFLRLLPLASRSLSLRLPRSLRRAALRWES